MPALRIYTLSLLLLLTAWLGAQTDHDMDEVARSTPLRATSSVESLAGYLKTHTPDERGCIRAIFAWVTLHIRYLDTSNATEIWATPEHLALQQPETVLTNRSAVCQGFANLFQALAHAAGMECAVVTGIVRNHEGQVLPIGHAWAAARVAGQWQLFDPTWSVPQRDRPWEVNDIYFMPPPERFALDHLPDDPVWQLLSNPIREAQFKYDDSDQILRHLRQAGPFNYLDTLQQWFQTPPAQRLLQAENRILAFNRNNERVLFDLGQHYWGLFYDLQMQLDTLSDRSILDKTIPIDTSWYLFQLEQLDTFHQRARFYFELITEPERVAMTKKFYSVQDVEALREKLRGDLWVAYSVHQQYVGRQSRQAEGLQQILSVNHRAHATYQKALNHLDCNKLRQSCYEVYHNLSLIDLQLAEPFGALAQQLLSGRNAHLHIDAAREAMREAGRLLDRGETAARALYQYPPVFQLVEDRLQRVQNGRFFLRTLDLHAQQAALSPQIERLLERQSDQFGKAIPAMEQQLGALAELLNTLEDMAGSTDPAFYEITSYNLHLEAYAMQVNQASLYFTQAVQLYDGAIRKKTLEGERKKIQHNLQQGKRWAKEAASALEFLKKSRRMDQRQLEQRQQQLKQLNQFIKDFIDRLE